MRGGSRRYRACGRQGASIRGARQVQCTSAHAAWGLIHVALHGLWLCSHAQLLLRRARKLLSPLY